MAEIEAKLLADDAAEIEAFLQQFLPQYLVPSDAEEPTTLQITDRYLDTREWHVLRAGWAYRWREVSGQRSLTLKSVDNTDDVIQVREEIEQVVDTFPRDSKVLPDGLVARQLGKIAAKQLHPLFQVNNHRRRYLIRIDAAVLEVALDHVTITSLSLPSKAITSELKFDELEVELQEGSEETLRAFVESIRSQFDFFPARSSKFSRGLLTLGDPGPGMLTTKRCETRKDKRRLPATCMNIEMPVGRLAMCCLHDDFEKLLNAEATAWEGIDPEGVHRMRVATRRIRAALRRFKKALPTPAEKTFCGEFGWLADTLGKVRDLDVYRQQLRRYATMLSPDDYIQLRRYEDHLAAEWRVARRALRCCLSSPRYQQLIDNFATFVEDHRAVAEINDFGSRPVSKAAARLIAKPYKTVLRDGRAITVDSPVEAFHALRIDCKRLRYLLEFLQPASGALLIRPIKRLRAIQESLGDYHDADVATARLREFAAIVPPNEQRKQELLVLGQLIHAQQQRAIESRRAFSDAWRRFDDKHQRTRLFAKLRSLHQRPTHLD